MHRRDVVGLHRILDVDLPVGFERVLLEAHAFHVVEAIAREHVREVDEVILERPRLIVEADEDEPRPHLQLERDQREILHAETRGFLHLRRDDELAFEVVGPGMVRAANRVAIAVAAEHGRAAMAARVGERPHLVVLAADHDDRHADEIHREIVSGIRHAIGAAEEIPLLHPDRLDLAAVKLFRGVSPGRQRARLGKGLAHAFVVARIEDVRDGRLANEDGAHRNTPEISLNLARILFSSGSPPCKIAESKKR